MKNKNLFIKIYLNYFFVSLLFIMACKADVEKKHVEENKKIGALTSKVSTLKNDSKYDKFKEYKEEINQLKESLKDARNEELKAKILNL